MAGMTETIDELGPVVCVVIEFPGNTFKDGEIAPALGDLIDQKLHTKSSISSF